MLLSEHADLRDHNLMLKIGKQRAVLDSKGTENVRNISPFSLHRLHLFAILLTPQTQILLHFVRLSCSLGCSWSGTRSWRSARRRTSAGPRPRTYTSNSQCNVI